MGKTAAIREFLRLAAPKKSFVLLMILLQIGEFIFEAASLGMFLPIAQILMSGEDGASAFGDSKIFILIDSAFAYIGIIPDLVTLIAVSFLLFIIRQLFTFLKTVISPVYREHLVTQMRLEGFRRFVAASSEYHDRLETGRVINDLNIELLKASKIITTMINFAHQLIMASGYFLFLLTLSSSLLLAIIGFAAVVFLLIGKTSQIIEEIGYTLTKANQNLLSYMLERFSNVNLLRLTGIIEASGQHMMSLTTEQWRHFRNQTVMSSLVSAIIGPASLGMVFVCLGTGYYFLDMPGTEVGLFITILVRMIPILQQLVGTKQEIHSYLGPISTINKIFSDMTSNREYGGGDRVFGNLKHGIQFKNVSYTYTSKDPENDNPQPTLDDISFSLPVKMLTAIVGPSGSGKSTIIDTIPMLRRAHNGQILIDGRSLEEFSTVSVRKAIAYAPQFPSMFNTTIREHIRLGKLEANESEIMEAAKQANAHDFILDLPSGYETLLGDRGGNISGGQARRIDLARVLLADSEILILDEPTTGLDPVSEKMIVNTLKEIQNCRDKTIIVISHKISALTFADQFIVVLNGRVSAQGPHEQLINQSDWYAAAIAS